MCRCLFIALLRIEERGVIVARAREISIQFDGCSVALLGQLKFARALVHQCKSLVHFSVVRLHFVSQLQVALGVFPITFANVLTRELNPALQCFLRVSFVGKNERELTEQKIPYEIGRAYFKDTARAHISGEEVGMLKILFHQDTLEILGIHCFGAEAAEIIHIGQAIMSQKGEANSIKYFLRTTFNYPTMAEAYRIASMNGLNRVSREHRRFEAKQR